MYPHVNLLILCSQLLLGRTNLTPKFRHNTVILFALLICCTSERINLIAKLNVPVLQSINFSLQNIDIGPIFLALVGNFTEFVVISV